VSLELDSISASVGDCIDIGVRHAQATVMCLSDFRYDHSFFVELLILIDAHEFIQRSSNSEKIRRLRSVFPDNVLV
jgi:hypothetical protein